MAKQETKVYEAPRLVVYGSVEEITQFHNYPGTGDILAAPGDGNDLNDGCPEAQADQYCPTGS